ncbi:MAG: hypothetical protein AAF548_07005 [Actinomycetota bacterium]
MARRRGLKDYRMPDDTHPVCPKCDRPTDGLMSRQIASDMGKAYVWCCPYCHVILGVTHRKGFWMG